MAKKIITVFGATGAQGGGLVRAILQDPDGEFAVRAVTRDPESDKSKELAAMGAELVQADIDDTESLKKALDGAHGAYFVTFYWLHYDPKRETAEAEAFAKAAKEAGLKHVIWSTLEDVRNFVPLDSDQMPTLMGNYKVPHFDGKGEGDHFFTDLGVPTTFMLASFYWDNFIYFGSGPKRGADGVLALTFPMGDKKISGIAAEDIGQCAYGIFKKGPSLVGKRIGIAGGEPTIQEMADKMSKALGEKVVYNEVSPDVYRGFGFPGADDLGNMFQFYRDFEDACCGTRDVAYSKELYPGIQSFDQWLEKNSSKIPLD